MYLLLIHVFIGQKLQESKGQLYAVIMGGFNS